MVENRIVIAVRTAPIIVLIALREALGTCRLTGADKDQYVRILLPMLSATMEMRHMDDLKKVMYEAFDREIREKMQVEPAEQGGVCQNPHFAGKKTPFLSMGSPISSLKPPITLNYPPITLISPSRHPQRR
ncbi:MAG: hypothetical protein EOM12_15590 [Verrucomicrobiae bacterium]|nr:hypothetical protein [Verrucomicrobiae bacterium]